MARKPKHDDPEQSKLFIETARTLEADESAEGFERAFRRVVPSKRIKGSAQKAHRKPE